MIPIKISRLQTDKEFEVVERKGAGHPDTICDALAEALSRNLCREYQSRFDRILHHNVDKALLCGGQSAPCFGGGRVIAPIKIILAGRAVTRVGNDELPISEIAVEGSKVWLRENLHAIDVDRHVEVGSMIQQGSQDLRSLFARGGERVALANDTSFGVGHAPLSALERLVLAIEQRLHRRDRMADRPAWGEDIKIMAVRSGSQLTLTIACAMIGRYLSGLQNYLEQETALVERVRGCAHELGFVGPEIFINAADDIKSGNIYLTVTGTSAEAGDDGQVGRGNRVNGLITPCRPMSLEAAAGKNPVSHVGKIYNVVATRMAEALVADLPGVNEAQCFIVSKIGAPVSEPALVHVKLGTEEGAPSDEQRDQTQCVIADHLARVPELANEVIAGRIMVF